MQECRPDRRREILLGHAPAQDAAIWIQGSPVIKTGYILAA